MQVKRIERVVAGVLFALFALLMAVTIASKMNFHLDEILSYTLANNRQGIFVDFNAYQKYMPAKDAFFQSMTVSADQRFNYAKVFANQAADVHPPLYYIFLHTICSLFPGTFSKWYAGVINIVFGLLTFFFVRKLVAALLRGTGLYPELVICLVSVAFVFSAGVQNAVSFLRMYVMAMCWVTAFTFLLVDQIAKPHTRRFYLSVFAVAFLGAITHYYCIVYTVFACAVYGVYLLAHKRWKETGLFTGAMALAGGVSVAVFPAMLYHMFAGFRGEEAVQNLSVLSDYGEKIEGFFKPLSQQMFSGLLPAALVFMGVLFLCGLYFRTGRKAVDAPGSKRALCIGENAEVGWRFACAALPSIFYFLLVSKISSLLADRYIFPIYAVSFAWILALLAVLFGAVFTRKAGIGFLCAALTAVMVIGQQEYHNGEYLYKDSGEFLEKVKTYSGVDCLCLYNNQWAVASTFAEVSNYNSITLVPYSEIENITDLDIAQKQDMIVLLVEADDPEARIQQIMEYCPQMKTSQYVGGYAATTYYLSAER